MFRRTSKVDDQPALEPKGPGAKGRPTPTRRESEAVRRARAKPATDKKSVRKMSRERKIQSSGKVREAMRSGDERYLPKKDQGPVKRFIRNSVDARFSIAEFLLPILIVIMALSYSGNKTLQSFGVALQTTTLLVVSIDTVWTMVRLRRALRAKFPGQSLKGTTYYTLLRLAQMRWLRMPKPQVRIGGSPR